jgi:hypothetical protein
MRISEFIRQPRRYKKYLFDDLSPEVRCRAEGLLAEFCRKHHLRLASERWLYPVLIGQARRLAVKPPTSEWGRMMLGKLGGKRVQQLYREQGRTGREHPAHKAARVSAARRRSSKEEKLREATGLPPRTRSRCTDIG